MTEPEILRIILDQIKDMDRKLDESLARAHDAEIKRGSIERQAKRAHARADELRDRLEEVAEGAHHHRVIEHGLGDDEHPEPRYNPWVANERTQLWYARGRIAVMLLVLGGLLVPQVWPQLRGLMGVLR